MAKTKPKSKTPDVLKGWAAISKFLGLTATTAQRWAKAGMPVRREGRFVVAERDKLQEWLGRHTTRNAFTAICSIVRPLDRFNPVRFPSIPTSKRP
jgi:hypothetical protein